MSKQSRSERIARLKEVAGKYFQPVLPPEDRSVLETLMYACCLEDAPYDAADEALGRLQESYFDWNEIRVTTITELSETLHNLPNPRAAAIRVKKNLQSVFETRYSFDLEDLRRLKLTQAVDQLEKLGGMTRFVLGYVVQHALDGHAIPVSESIMALLQMVGVVSDQEAAQGKTPGLERAIPKSEGIDFASRLHQFAVLVATRPNSPKVKSMLKEAGYAPTAETTEAAKESSSKQGQARATSAVKSTAKKKKAAADKKSTEKKASAKKKKTAKKKVAGRSSARKKTAKSTAKRKPR